MVIIESKLVKSSTKVVLLFGVGLIGESILRQFKNHFVSVIQTYPFTWGQKDQQTTQLQSIKESILSKKDLDRVEVIWSAGKGGFYSKDEDFELEFVDLERVMQWLEKEIIPLKPCNFHLFSSAGGLFEGQLLVNQQSVPKPLRPYGHWKLKQELLLAQYEKFTNRTIYRPSTVYGYSPNARIGLIAKLLICAKKNEFIEIFASKTALRDYIFVQDIASYLLKVIESNDSIEKPRSDIQTQWLVSGKSSNILEICTKVSEMVNKPILNSFRLELDNNLDNTYNPQLKPCGLEINPMEIGLYKIFQSLR